jgi:hypothetical protein
MKEGKLPFGVTRRGGFILDSNLALNQVLQIAGTRIHFSRYRHQFRHQAAPSLGNWNQRQVEMEFSERISGEILPAGEYRYYPKRKDRTPFGWGVKLNGSKKFEKNPDEPQSIVIEIAARAIYQIILEKTIREKACYKIPSYEFHPVDDGFYYLDWDGGVLLLGVHTGY